MTFRCRICGESIARDLDGDWAHLDDQVIVNFDNIRVVGGSAGHRAEPEFIDAECIEKNSQE